MNALRFLAPLLFLAAPMLCSAIEVRLSVKFIRNNDAGGTRPAGNISTAALFDTEISRGNAVLDATGRGHTLKVVEYLDIQPPAPVGATVNVTGGTTMASPTVTCSNTAGLQVNMFVQGTGIPANAVIDSIQSNVSFTMSANAAATNGSVAITANYPSNFWFDLPARSKRDVFEGAALVDKVTWRWHESAINIYVNNTRSGSCSFVGGGLSIALGGQVGIGTVLHEIGHYFNLFHTHALDYTTNTNPPNAMPPGVFTLADLMDGDGLPQTALDNPNITTKDQLSNALFGVPYTQPPAPPNAPFATPAQRASVDSSFENVMSYHNENVLLPVQMNIWTGVANDGREIFCNGQTFYVAPFPFSNSDPQFNGATTFFPAFLERALALSGNAQDVLLFQRNYPIIIPGQHIVINQACIIAAPGEPITIGGDSF